MRKSKVVGSKQPQRPNTHWHYCLAGWAGQGSSLWDLERQSADLRKYFPNFFQHLQAAWDQECFSERKGCADLPMAVYLCSSRSIPILDFGRAHVGGALCSPFCSSGLRSKNRLDVNMDLKTCHTPFFAICNYD